MPPQGPAPGLAARELVAAGPNATPASETGPMAEAARVAGSSEAAAATDPKTNFPLHSKLANIKVMESFLQLPQGLASKTNPQRSGPGSLHRLLAAAAAACCSRNHGCKAAGTQREIRAYV